MAQLTHLCNFVLFLFVIELYAAHKKIDAQPTNSSFDQRQGQDVTSPFHLTLSDLMSAMKMSNLSSRDDKADRTMSARSVLHSDHSPIDASFLRPDPFSSASDQRAYLTQAHLQFTFNLLSNLLMREHVRPTDLLASSFAFSPLSVQSILMQMHLSAAGQTRQQLADVLHLSNLLPNEVAPSSPSSPPVGPHSSVSDAKDFDSTPVSKAHELFANQLRELLEAKQVRPHLRMVSRLLHRPQLRVQSNIQRLVSRLYGPNTVQSLDFSQPDRAQRWINDLVAQTTEGHLTRFLATAPSTSTALMALNALHFRSDWRYGFDSQDTEAQGEFHLSSGRRVRQPTMVGTFSVAFGRSAALQATAIELPYRPAARLSMFFVLPDKLDGLFPMIQALNASTFCQLIAQMRKQPSGVQVRLPRFTIDSQHPLQTVLSSMGCRSLFSAGECDLSPLFAATSSLSSPAAGNNGPPRASHSTDSDHGASDPLVNQLTPTVGSSHWFGPLHVSEFVHRVRLRVDEQGSVASAATATMVDRIGLFSGPYFEADHPFVFLLMDKQSGLVLFAGVFAGPSAKHSS
jgi:serine protease inhibitor